jgi:hypothetical protein
LLGIFYFVSSGWAVLDRLLGFESKGVGGQVQLLQ